MNGGREKWRTGRAGPVVQHTVSWCDAKPFRFIWNKSDAVAANVYLLLYPKGRLKAALDADPSLYATVFEFLRGIGAHEFIGQGRVYGGGLHKMEPRELGRVSAERLVRKLRELKIENQSTLS